MDALQFVGVHPWFDDFFILPLFWACDGDCSYERAFREDNDIFIIVRSLVVIWSS